MSCLGTEGTPERGFRSDFLALMAHNIVLQTEILAASIQQLDDPPAPYGNAHRAALTTILRFCGNWEESSQQELAKAIGRALVDRAQNDDPFCAPY
jgi:hypothetical protein